MSESQYGDFKERRQEGVWDFLNRLMVALIVFAAVILIISAFIPLLKEQRDEASRVEELKTEKARLTASLARASREVDHLQHDPDYVGDLARDRLDVMKEGETIYRFDQPPPDKSGFKLHH